MTVNLHRPTDPHDARSGNLTGLKRTRTFSPFNVVLVRWDGGWAEEHSGGMYTQGRREATLGLGAIISRAQVTQIAQSDLLRFGEPRDQYEPLIEPGDGPAPYDAGFELGNNVGIVGTGNVPIPERLLRIAVSSDTEGHPIYGAVVKDLILSDEERFAQWVQKMANGTLGGDSAVAQPVAQIAPAATAQPAPPGVTCSAITVHYSGHTYRGGTVGLPDDTFEYVDWSLGSSTILGSGFFINSDGQIETTVDMDIKWNGQIQPGVADGVNAWQFELSADDPDSFANSYRGTAAAAIWPLGGGFRFPAGTKFDLGFKQASGSTDNSNWSPGLNFSGVHV